MSKPVFFTEQEGEVVHIGEAENWDDVAMVLADYAEQEFIQETNPDSNGIGRRLECCQRLAWSLGLDLFPALSNDNAQEHDDRYTVDLRPVERKSA
jgi:hypothetical protein